jgi:hypothetical protein
MREREISVYVNIFDKISAFVSCFFKGFNMCYQHLKCTSPHYNSREVRRTTRHFDLYQ